MVGEKTVIIWGTLLLLLALSVSAVPGVPHRFFGSVTINGEPAPDGSFIEAIIPFIIFAGSSNDMRSCINS